MAWLTEGRGIEKSDPDFLETTNLHIFMFDILVFEAKNRFLD